MQDSTYKCRIGQKEEKKDADKEYTIVLITHSTKYSIVPYPADTSSGVQKVFAITDEKVGLYFYKGTYSMYAGLPEPPIF